MCRSLKNGHRRRCPSCTSYPAAARANGNRRLGRLARRKVVDHLLSRRLDDSAAAVLAASPSVLSEFMTALSIDRAVLGDTPMPGAGPTSPTVLISAAKAEVARREAEQRRVVEQQRQQGDNTARAPKPIRPRPVGTQGASAVDQGAAMRLAQSVARARGQRVGRRPAAAAAGPNCRSNMSVIAEWETRAEEAFGAESTKAQCRSACAEAEMLCKGCPLMESCAAEAKASHYTGIAGGRIFVNGRQRLTPSAPARIDAA
ncbi:hypothetical protein MycrhDRAFT_5600 [Mycolicibacterium rhodesiae JS60]|nr:hypothetical protein MycrhDRAFT_5600 [Mycolicibacterium rhodesiae JS60]